jgi:DNA-binding NtrC family response regulator
MQDCLGTILLVDDDATLLWLTAQMLTACGYSVFQAASGTEAWEFFSNHPGEIQLVLSDIMMPGMLGDRLVQKLREIKPDLRFILMSGNTFSSLETEVLIEEGINFLQKPFSFDELKDIVSLQLDLAPP